MKKIETFMPEEGDYLVVIQDVPDFNLSAGDSVIFVNSMSMGAVCTDIVEGKRMLIPFNILKGINGEHTVDLTFE